MDRGGYDVFFGVERRQELLKRYSGFDVPSVSVGSVRDYCDSVDHLGPLASHQEDLKDQQRCWMLKAVLGTFEPGARLVEIGAGEPVVAGILSRFGYTVTVVDPYDGCGNGPLGFDRFVSEYPDIEFKREYLGEQTDFGGRKFDGFYSISVMEHVQPASVLKSLTAGIKNHSHDRSIVLHAVDHVMRGAGAAYHADMLERVGADVGVTRADLDRVLDPAELDVETYFLSAEAHNRWRGGLSYDEFPMRRCVSVQFRGKPV